MNHSARVRLVVGVGIRFNGSPNANPDPSKIPGFAARENAAARGVRNVEAELKREAKSVIERIVNLRDSL